MKTDIRQVSEYSSENPPSATIGIKYDSKTPPNSRILIKKIYEDIMENNDKEVYLKIKQTKVDTTKKLITLTATFS
jgi:hypothetical protein